MFWAPSIGSHLAFIDTDTTAYLVLQKPQVFTEFPFQSAGYMNIDMTLFHSPLLVLK